MPDEYPTGTPPAPAPAPKADEKPSAAETAAKGKTPKEIQLEKKVSELEDAQNTLKGQVTELTKFVESAKAAPSARKPGKSILDELDEFICGAPAESPAAPAKP